MRNEYRPQYPKFSIRGAWQSLLLSVVNIPMYWPSSVLSPCLFGETWILYFFLLVCYSFLINFVAGSKTVQSFLRDSSSFIASELFWRSPLFILAFRSCSGWGKVGRACTIKKKTCVAVFGDCR